ncbi:MAG: NADPH:quinone oxidoreductase family protein [Solirubrobacterales bacterium]
MRAIRTHQKHGGPDDVVEEEIAAPEPGDQALIIDVRAAGVSFPDLLLSKGEYQIKPEPPFTLGSEGAGRVAHAPEGSGFSVGDRVAFLTLGAYAEQVQTAPLMTFPLPDELSYQAGAALIINYHTVLFALRDRGQLKSGEDVLVQGAAGGVGTAAIQVAKALGARVIAGVSSDEKAEVALEAGADDVVFTGGDEWRQRVRELTDGRGVDVVLDPVGGDHFTDNIRSLAEGGRLLVVGFAGGSIPEVKVNRLLLHNVSVVGVAWGAYVGTRPELAKEIGETVNAMAVRGEIKPLIGSVFNFEDAADALKLLEDRKATGKVVLQISEDD